MSLQQFEAILKSLLTIDNVQRSQAEVAFNQSKTVPEQHVGMLLTLLRQSAMIEVCMLESHNAHLAV